MTSLFRFGKLLNPIGVFGSATTLIGITILLAAIIMERVTVDGNTRFVALILAIPIILYASLLFGYFRSGDEPPTRPPGYRLRMMILAQNYVGWRIGPGLIFYVYGLF
ncbi:MAG: hypothetical protein AAGG69_06785 [Pseudomonadota bacterium]